MSEVVNTEGMKPGVIYRIALENFVTYKQVELFPGPSLNMIIGPNGTGKSTFLCAIILGLCGKTSVIGRAKKISEYVRSGCEEASIEIELYQQEGRRNVTITRNFNIKDATRWFIDKKDAREKQVQDMIAAMNIQVDNLCQLLPQDRVQDFSKLNPQELLRSTLSAVAGQRSVTQLDELIETRRKQRGLSTKLQNNEQLLQEHQIQIDRLKVTMEAMQQRKDLEHQIQVCEMKKLWIEYNELRARILEQNKDKIIAEKLVKTHMSKMAPLEKVIEDAKIDIGKVEKENLMAGREIHTFREKIIENIKKLRDYDYAHREVDASFEEKLERYRHKGLELTEANVLLDKYKSDKARLLKKVGDEKRVQMETAEVMKGLSKNNAAMDILKKQQLEVQYDLENNIMPQIRLYQNKIREIHNVGSKRLEALRTYSDDAYKAVGWLRANRGLFEHQVYEPMMLEINFKEPRFARYLENTVSPRDLVAFTFESSRDMNLFLRKVRQEAGLRRVNAICSQGGPLTIERNNIQQLSYLGFYTYVLDTISAPDAILRYLCNHYRINQIPIGNDHTYNNNENVPANIKLYFTENHRFSVRVSNYSGAKSSSTSEMRAARLLKNTVDADKINNYNQQLSNFESISQSHNAKIQALNEKVSTVEVSMNELNAKRRDITEAVEKVRTLNAQIRLQTKKVEDIEKEPSLNVAQERVKVLQKHREIAKNQLALQREIVEVERRLRNRNLNGRCICKVKLDYNRDVIVHQESGLSELRSELNTAQSTLGTIEASIKRGKSTVREMLTEAKSRSNDKLPSDPDFPDKEQYEGLPSDLRLLTEHCFDLQTRLEFMDPGDEQVIKEYEEHERIIAKLRTEKSNSIEMNKVLEEQLNRLSLQWLPPLESLITNIDNNFGNMFSNLGCAGEVRLDCGGNDDDYDKYGINILVSFRPSEELQQLTRHAQSGGERAMATATYLLSLQALTAVPFRCVDEINQGMDPINDRKMFQLLVQVTTETDNAQYFLLTPKLLTSLEYNEKIMVHTIMNGHCIMNYQKWNYNKFLENAQNYRM